MAPVTDQQLAVLAPYIGSAKPDDRGEVNIFCPLHNDMNRSASINLSMGAWYCHAGCGGGSIRGLLDQEDNWIPAESRTAVTDGLTLDKMKSAVKSTIFKSQDQLLEDTVRWHNRLMNDEKQLHYLYELRGIEQWTIRKGLIGFDGCYFKIPVFSPTREIWNIRSYDPTPARGRRKIWSLRGFGRARIYPAGVLERVDEGDAIIFCEGEWDTLLALQSGYHAVTRTDGAGKPWHREWDVGFAGLRIFTCGDADEKGVEFNNTIATALAEVAEEVREVVLPYRIKPDHGRDLTDFLLDAEEPGTALGELMKQSKGASGEDSNIGVRPGRFDRGAYAY